MGEPIVASKLALPMLPPWMVSRPRLFAAVDAGVTGPATLVAAPAGAGKTTLLGSWAAVAQLPGPIAWVSIEAADNDPLTFWTYSIAALCRSGALPADNRLHRLDSAQRDEQTLLPEVVTGLTELSTPVVLVLDDVQELTNPLVFDGLSRLLRQAPPQLRLLLSTRVDPPLPLPRLLLGGVLTELRTADLAFTVDEAAELLADANGGPRLSEDELVSLHARTEGWAAGLRLAALSLRGHDDPHRTVTEFAGDSRIVAAYLVAEVLEPLPDELRSFLLTTCVVDQLNGDLADTLTGRDDGERILADLVRLNAFVVAARQPGWYRYHPLLVEMLRQESRRRLPHRADKQRLLAAGWYASHSMPSEAVELAVAAGEWSAAADVIAEHGLRLVLEGHPNGLGSLLGHLPPETIASDPELTQLAAAEPTDSRPARQVSTHVQLAEVPQRDSGLGGTRFGLLLATRRLVAARAAGAIDEVIASSRRLLCLVDRDAMNTGRSDVAAFILCHLGTAELWTGDLAAAEDHLTESHALAVQSGLASTQVDAMSQLAMLHILRGQFSRAEVLGRTTTELAERLGGASARQATGGYLALAETNYQRDQLGAAWRYLNKATAASRVKAEPPMAVAIGVTEGRLRRAEGDHAGAFQAIEAARRGAVADGYVHESLRRWLVATEAELRRQVGDHECARGRLAGLEAGPAWLPPATVALARLRLAEGDPAGAAEAVSSLLAGGPGGMDAAAWLVDALACDAIGDTERAAASLRRALELAEWQDARRTLLDGGDEVRGLLVCYRDRIPTSWSFLEELIEDTITPTRCTRVVSLPAMVEPLSARERTVLRYLPSDLTYVEIASELFVSPHTIKSHTRNIYRKLGAADRRDAVGRARQLRLLRV